MKTLLQYSFSVLLALSVSLGAFAQQQQTATVVRGQVIASSDGEPLISVAITELDPSNRIVGVTVTNYDGEYVIQVANPKNILRFKYIGFETKDVVIGDKKVINVALDEQTHALQEAVVTAQAMMNDGRFSIPQREVSMAMQKISADEFEGIGVTSVDDALQGRIAGLDIVNVSGEPGAGMSMRVRGTTSINASSEPLIVVNDIIFETQIDDDFDFATANQDAYAQLISVNPDDIEEIVVLKDAASTAIWGTRGANGVLSITTKRGKAGPTRVNYSLSVKTSRQPKGMNMLTGDDYTMLMKQEYYLPHLDNTLSNIPELNYDTNFTEYENFNNNNDWREIVSRRSLSLDNNLTISGGGEKVTFRVSAAYTNERGTVIGQALNRMSLRSTIDYQVSDRIRFSSDFAYSYSDNPKNYEDVLGVAYQKMPNLSVYAQDLNGNDTENYYHVRPDSKINDSQKALSNPVAVAALASNVTKSYRTSPVFTLSYEFLDRNVTASSLRLNGSVSFDINSSQKTAFFPKVASNKAWNDDKVNLAERSESESTSMSAKADLVYHPSFENSDHSFQVMGRFSVSMGSSESLGMSISGLPSSEITSASLNSYVKTMSSGYSESRSMSYAGSTHYAYKGRYITSLTLTQAGSSKFGNNYKFGLFPGLSFKWIISDEPFFEPVRDVISFFSPRYSWGLTGNEPKDDFLYFSRYTKYSEPYIDMIAMYPKNMRLSELRWEKTTQNNFGLDTEFFNGKFGFDFNYYHKHTTDLLFNNLGISSSSGFTALPSRNVGTMDNDGWEFNGHFRNIVDYNGFRIDMNFNFSNNRNTIIELTPDVLEQYNKDYAYDNGSYLTRIQVGNSIGSIYGFIYDGVYEYNNYDASRPDATCPVVRNSKGEVIFDADGNTKPMYFAYGKAAQYEFKAGDAIYRDINSDGSIDELDIVYLGNSLPKINGGMGLTFRYKNFSFTPFFNFRYGNKVVNGARMKAENMYTNDNQSIAVNWRWRKEGDQTEMPRALYNWGYNWLGSSRYVEDASFFRCKYLTFNYSVPREILKPYHLSSLSLYLSIQNIAVLTRYTGVDPEVGYGGFSVATDGSKTPRPKDILLRLRLGF